MIVVELSGIIEQDWIQNIGNQCKIVVSVWLPYSSLVVNITIAHIIWVGLQRIILILYHAHFGRTLTMSRDMLTISPDLYVSNKKVIHTFISCQANLTEGKTFRTLKETL